MTTADKRGIDLLAAGQRSVRRARHLNEMDEGTGTQLADAEAEARRGLGMLRSAMNWLEDQDEAGFARAHQILDESGRWTRETFGCTLSQSGTTYSQACPVALAHNRIGMSIEARVGKVECSICGHDPEDDRCPHIRGRDYEGVTCFHKLGDLMIEAVAIVGTPAQPDARFASVSISHDDLRRRLGDDFQPGVRINCDFCLEECTGLSSPGFLSH